MMTNRLIALFAAALALTACAGKMTLRDRAVFLAEDYQVYRPQTAEQVPVVLLFHGCGGLYNDTGEKDIMKEYAEVAMAEGYAAIIVDSFTPRGIEFREATRKVCTGRRLRGRDRAGDVVAALAWAEHQPWAKPDSFVLAGWSHGGWSVMEAMIMDLETDWPRHMKKPEVDLYDQLAGVYLTYPFCGFPSRARNKGWVRPVPTSILTAENDTVAKEGPCEEAFARMAESGVPMDVEMYAGVTHAFDENDQTPESSFKYDAAAAERAHRRFAAFLAGLES